MATLEDTEVKITKTGTIGWYHPLNGTHLLPAKVTLGKSNGTVDLTAVEVDPEAPLREAIDINVLDAVPSEPESKRYFVADPKAKDKPITLDAYHGREEKTEK